MPCKKHDWLLVGEITRETDASREMKASADKYKKIADDETEHWWKRRASASAAMGIASMMSMSMRDCGKKYRCAMCDEVREVF